MSKVNNVELRDAMVEFAVELEEIPNVADFRERAKRLTYNVGEDRLNFYAWHTATSFPIEGKDIGWEIDGKRFASLYAALLFCDGVTVTE